MASVKTGQVVSSGPLSSFKASTQGWWPGSLRSRMALSGPVSTRTVTLSVLCAEACDSSGAVPSEEVLQRPRARDRRLAGHRQRFRSNRQFGNQAGSPGWHPYARQPHRGLCGTRRRAPVWRPLSAVLQFERQGERFSWVERITSLAQKVLHEDSDGSPRRAK